MGIVIVGLDPGETTGVAIFERGEFDYLTLKGNYWTDYIHDLLDLAVGADIILAEEFIGYKQAGRVHAGLAGNKMIPARILGWLEGQVAIELDLAPSLFLTMAGHSKKRFPDEKLKLLGLWPRNRHQRDALRQVLCYMEDQRYDWLMQKYREKGL